MKHIRLSSGESIWVFDDIFKQIDIMSMEVFCQDSAYKSGGTSTPLNAHAKETFMVSSYSEEDIKNFGIFLFDGSQQFKPILDKHKLNRAWVLAASRSDKYFYHSDLNYGLSGVTLLYFVNSTWDKDWGCEMLFASNRGEPEIVIGYKPNRAIIFDGTIIHKPAPSAIDAQQYAYMFVAQFIKDQA